MARRTATPTRDGTTGTNRLFRSADVDKTLRPMVLAGLAAMLVCAGMTGCGPAEPPTLSEPFRVLATFGDVGSSPGQFSYPRCLDSDGRSLWVIDKSARVQRLDPETGASLGGWRMPEWNVGKPTGIHVWRPEGRNEELVFVADTHYHRVMVYRVLIDPAAAIAAGARDGAAAHPPLSALAKESPASFGPLIGAFVTKFGSYGEGPGQFVYPTDVLVVPTADGKRIEKLFVSEYGGHDRISVWKPKNPDHDPLAGSGWNPGSAADTEDYQFVSAFGSFGSSASTDQLEFSRPQSMVLDARNRELIVSDACNHRIGRFDLDGRLIRWIGGPESAGAEPGQMSYPYGITLPGDGSVFAAEFGGSRIQRFDLATGAPLGVFGKAGRRPGEVMTPWSVCAIGDRLFVLDSSNNRVQSMKIPRPPRIANTGAESNSLPSSSRPRAGGDS